MDKNYIAKNGSVIDSRTGTTWYSGYSQKMADDIADVFNRREWDRLIHPQWKGWTTSNEIIGVKPR